MKLVKTTKYGCRRNEFGRPSSPKTELLTKTLLDSLTAKDFFPLIEREKMIRLGGYHHTFKDVYAKDIDGDTWGFEVKTHTSDITHSEHGKECSSCNYNYFVVSPDCYYDIVKFLEENKHDHVGIIVGNKFWLDVMKEAVRIE